ncbi:peptide-methionine (R)-S-oxide reductase [Rhabdobacter roseus]|uniref:peptide-methionine (R)-S-oxide reductase n=1 Tax=Rhabdobacter roseus TaxID=1655419 RepID=A0A840U1S0_9BACT|nr:peptide-methionine (R)-S-oxide reductase MsrB [Rhabdobacter roseus]MBB5285799.1 peptide-methionine (R)-S-oxide reductase [Rhabdobacter roseus]
MRKMRLVVLLCALFGLVTSSCSQAQKKVAKTNETSVPRQVQKTEAEWKAELSQQQYYVLREKGTERPYSSPFNKNKDKGTYLCAACRTPLFSSETKFESGTGWPSFYKPLSEKNVEVALDNSAGMVRDEVLCRTCGGHLGHVFDDGPKPTGLRYCLNGVALRFEKKE